jgi:methionine synthase / methylenetetrahydrofolate reductase(NADPH)
VRKDILWVLGERVVVADGAMGSLLFDRGVDGASCYDALNLTDAALVRSIHQAYVAAGAEVIETNTFGANRIKLGRFDLAHKTREINLRGADLARGQAGDRCWVAGAMGPLGRMGEDQPVRRSFRMCSRSRPSRWWRGAQISSCWKPLPASPCS